MMMTINPNDESTLTSSSGNTPVPADSTYPADGSVPSDMKKDVDGGLLTKFPASIYADDNDNMMSESFAQEQSCHTELTGYLSDSQEEEEATPSPEGQDQAACLVVPEEVITCQDDILSLSDDKSIDDSSPVKRRRSCADPVSPLSVNQPSQCNEQDHESTAAEEQQKANTLLLVSNDSPDMNSSEFVSLRITYLIVTLVIMLADGLQGKNHDC